MTIAGERHTNPALHRVAGALVSTVRVQCLLYGHEVTPAEVFDVLLFAAADALSKSEATDEAILELSRTAGDAIVVMARNLRGKRADA